MIKIEYDRTHPDLQDCPAGADQQNSVIVINPDLFNQLTPFQQKFVIKHETGHIALKTNDEIQADAYAFDQLAGTEFRSLKQCIETLETLLMPGDPIVDKRIEALYDRALIWDKRH